MGQYSWSLALMEYGARWRNCRRLVYEFLNPKAVTNFDDYQRKHAYRFLSKLAESPEDFLDHAEL
jgi:cytochrome P450